MHPGRRLLALLADGDFRPRSWIAAELGIARGALDDLARALGSLGVTVESLPGRGLRLAAPLELLDAARIEASLPPAARAALDGLAVLFEVDSTNACLAREPAPAGAGARACLAEVQTAGRGRRGRAWISPLGANVYLSVRRRLARAPQELPGLGPALGVAVADALEGLGARGIALKWPNDLWHGGAKLGGILVESSITAGTAAATVVAGVGVNVAMPRDASRAIDQPWTDLAAAAGRAPSRNDVAAAVLAAVLAALARFETAGFAPFRDGWRARDALAGQAVALDDRAREERATAVGVDLDGALLVESGGATERVVAGEVSLRAAR